MDHRGHGVVRVNRGSLAHLGRNEAAIDQDDPAGNLMAGRNQARPRLAIQNGLKLDKRCFGQTWAGQQDLSELGIIQLQRLGQR